MKKLIAILLAVLMMLSLVACGAEEPAANQGGADKAPASVGDNAASGKIFEGRTLALAHRTTGPEGDALQAQINAFEEKTGCKVEVEVLAADADEAESVLLIRAATGSLPDVFTTNVGAKLWELDPAANLLDLSGYDWLSNVNPAYVTVTSDSATGAVYGIPSGVSKVGGCLYNKKVFADLGIEVPETWDELLAACQKIRDNSDADPVVAAFGLASGCQLLFLQQYYYVQEANPNFAADYTNKVVALSDSAEYKRGFDKLYSLWEKGYINSDPLSTGAEDAAIMLANGEAAMLFTRTDTVSSIESIKPEAADDIGFFPLPDVDPSVRGATLWMPHAWVASKNTENADVVSAFMEFMTSQEAVDIFCEYVSPVGAFLLNDVEVTADLASAVLEAQEWANKASAPAMEFSCNIKGSNMATILSMVGTGEYTPEVGLAEIEADNAIDAQQKGLAGW